MKSAEITKIYPKIGEGVYSKRDVSVILKLPYGKVSRWMNDFWGDYTFGYGDDKLINFKTLIEFYTFYHLRENGFSSQQIKKIHSDMAAELKTRYPFATKIHFDKSDKPKAKRYIYYEQGEGVVKTDGKKQLDIKTFLIPFFNKIEFNHEKIPVVDKYYPLANSKSIVVDPKLQFGQPTIAGTGIKADIINEFIKAGESKDNICKIYHLRIEQVEDAILYFKKSA